MSEANEIQAKLVEYTLKSHLKERKPSDSFDQVWARYNEQAGRPSSQVRKKAARAWFACAAMALLIVSIGWFTPQVRAAIGDFIDVKLIKNKSDHASIVTHWDVKRKWDEVKTYLTLEEAEKGSGASLPFPVKLADYAKGALSKEYHVTTDHGQIAGYFYSLRTKERMIDVTAKYQEPATPSFTAESRGQALVKETAVNGRPAKLFAVQEFPGYTLYFEKDGWKIVISGYAEGVGSSKAAPFTEEEIRQIAESIR